MDIRKKTLYFSMAFFAAICIGACGGSGSDTDLPEDELGQFGSLLNVAEFDASPDALPASVINRSRDPLPPIVNLTNLPSIATQGTPPKPLGSPGSCEAQSFAYGLGSYTAARNADGTVKWDATQPQNQVSAAFQYRYQHHVEGKSCPSGSLATPYLDYLIANGSPSAQDIPYEANCDYLDGITINPSFPNMDRFQIGSYAAIRISENPDAALQMIKEYVAQGHVVAFSGLVLQGYSAPTFSNGVIYTTATVPNSGHGQLVVGYDDTIGNPGNTGALLIQNSFGPQWPAANSGSAAPPGMAYWSYNTFKQTQGLCAVAYPKQVTQPTGQPLNASAGLMPRGILQSATQQADALGGPTYMLVPLWFSLPVKITSITLTEPATGTTMTGKYAHNFGNGTLFFKRSDGNQFVTGTYLVSISATTMSNAPVTYSGSFLLSGATPSAPPAAPITNTSNITDSIGDPVTVN